MKDNQCINILMTSEYVLTSMIFLLNQKYFRLLVLKKVFYICTDIQHIYILYLHIYLVIQSKYFVNNIKNNSRNVTTVLNEQFHFSSIVIMLWNNYKHKYSFMQDTTKCILYKCMFKILIMCFVFDTFNGYIHLKTYFVI